MKDVYPSITYRIQETAKMYRIWMFHIKILFVPVAHSEELFWSKMKRGIAMKNISFRLSNEEDTTRNAISSMAAEEFSRYGEHAKTEEEKSRWLSRNK